MDDSNIVGLFRDRAESAIDETRKKYGSYCRTIAYRILRSNEDAEECENDAYMALWNTIPPSSPENLRAFLGCIVRRLALNRLDYNEAAKRGGKAAEISDEYFECIPSGTSPVDEIATKEAINGFLASLSKKHRIIFLRRYWYMCTVKEISDGMGISESDVKVSLFRSRQKLKKHLEREGINV